MKFKKLSLLLITAFSVNTSLGMGNYFLKKAGVEGMKKIFTCAQNQQPLLKKALMDTRPTDQSYQKLQGELDITKTIIVNYPNIDKMELNIFGDISKGIIQGILLMELTRISTYVPFVIDPIYLGAITLLNSGRHVIRAAKRVDRENEKIRNYNSLYSEYPGRYAPTCENTDCEYYDECTKKYHDA